MSLSACSNYEETDSSLTPPLTRSGINQNKSTLSTSEAVEIANEVLKRTSGEISEINVTPLLSDGSSYKGMVCDTIAYIINYGDKEGFAVVVNDRRVTSPIAYNKKGELTNAPSFIKAAFLDNIPNYLYSLNFKEAANSEGNVKGSPSRRLIIEPERDVPVDGFYPFTKKITEVYGSKYAGNCVYGVVIGLSHCAKDLVFEGYSYHFPQMIDDLHKGPDGDNFIGLNSDVAIGVPTPIDPTMPVEFLAGYQGSIDAYNQLFYDVARAIDTDYSLEDRIQSNPLKALGLYNKLGFKVEPINFAFDLTSIVERLYDGYIVNLLLSYGPKEAGQTVPKEILGAFLPVVAGCDVNMGADGTVSSGYLYLTGAFGYDLNGYYDMDLLINTNLYKLTTIAWLPVKIED